MLTVMGCSCFRYDWVSVVARTAPATTGKAREIDQDLQPHPLSIQSDLSARQLDQIHPPSGAFTFWEVSGALTLWEVSGALTLVEMIGAVLQWEKCCFISLYSMNININTLP